MEVSWPPSDMEAFRVLLVFLMKNLQFLHCGRANGTVTYDLQFMSFDTSILFLAGSELYCAQLSRREAAERSKGRHCAHSILEVMFTADVSLFI